jgi:GNAT superfamily N-acetyltransferase
MNLTLHRVTDPQSPEFDALIDLYLAAHPASERKPVELLAAMVLRPSYLFLTANLGQSVAGFSVVCSFPESDVSYLEYMAVAEQLRGQKIGSFLFQQITECREVSGRSLLVEVDSDKRPSPLQAYNTRRKLFYRNLGCREVAGLDYLMPPVTEETPPPMDIMAFKKSLPDHIAKAQLREWLQAIYVNIYSTPANDSRMDQMLERLPQVIDWM